jgi:nucleoside-diphosphate-sugar epimerase
MRILITGANGYIGKTLHNALRDIHYVTAINRNSFDLTDAVAMSKFFKSKHYFDVVIHCAVAGGSRLQKDDWDIMDKNLTMYYNLLQFRKHYTKLIHFGSGAETYMSSEPYGYSKKVIAKSILNQDNFYNLKIFGVFDESELDTRFIKANIKRYINKEPMQIHKDRVMDFFYMQDLIKVVDYYMNEKDPPKEFDCVYEDKCTLGGIATMINNCSYPDEVEIQIQEEGFDLYMSKYRDPLPIELIGLAQGIKNVYNKLK